MYEGYWGLRERPFQNTPDPRFLYYSPAHEEALVRLLYAVSEGKGLGLLTGEVGTGKTLLCRVFRKELRDRGYGVATVVNPDLSAEDLLRAILLDLDVDAAPGLGRGELWRLLAEYVQERDGPGREAIVIVDEAQSISDARTLEAIRLLLNLVREGRFLVTVVLAGQPELRARVQRLPALRQRIGVACHLRALSAEETGGDVAHRLRTAGATGELFDAEAIEALHAASGGNPRELNTLADLALLLGSSEGVDRVTGAVVRRAVAEVAALPLPGSVDA